MLDVVIVGSGCAGNTAAVYAARANLKPLVIKGHEPGGQLSMTTLVENFPGFPEGINGPDLVENIRKQAENFGAEYKEGRVVEADLSRRPFKLNVEGEHIETRTLIIASGASAVFVLVNSISGLVAVAPDPTRLPRALPLWLGAVAAGALLGTQFGRGALPVGSLRRVLAIVLAIAAAKLWWT